MRVSRMWRDLKAQINAGLGHETERVSKPGDLAIFCPACPQPDINLPQGWESDPKRYQLYIMSMIFMLILLDGYIPGVLSLMAIFLLST